MVPLNTKTFRKQAFSLIEIMIAVLVFTLFSSSVVYLSLDTATRATQVELKDDALLYAEEGMEAVRNMRDRNYLDLTAGSYGLDFTSDTWTFIAAPETIDDFYQRTILIEEVYRDGNGDIAELGTLDTETKKVTVSVTWNWKTIFPKTMELTTYFTNWTGDEWMQTTCSEFTAGTFTDSEAEASASPPADNCTVNLTLVEGQSDFFESVDVGDHGTDIVVDGSYAYLTTGKTNEGLVIADISDPENPFVVAEFDIGGKGRYITKDGNYLYIGVAHSSKGLAIVDVSDPASPVLTKQYNVGAYGNMPMVSGNTLFMGIEKSTSSFLAINITNKSSPSTLGTYNPGAETRSVHLYGSYAYIGTTASSNSFRVINIASPSSMTLAAQYSPGSAVNAIEVYSSVAYLGLDNSSSSLKVLNMSNPLSPSLVMSVNVSGKIQDLAIQDGYLYAPTDQTNYSLAVLNVSSPLAPVLTYFADLTGKGTGVFTTTDNVYLSLDTNNKGLVLVETVNVELASPGYFTSEVLDTGSTDTRYNFIEWEGTVPLTGSLEFQIRTASTSVGISSATWVGSDGTSGTTYTTSPEPIILDPFRSGSQYVQVRAIFTSDGVSSPVLDSFSVNYNP